MNCKYCKEEMVLKTYETPVYDNMVNPIGEIITSKIWACKNCHYAVRVDDDETEQTIL